MSTSQLSSIGHGKDTEKVVVLDSDEALLAQIGYRQELGRNMGLLQNFGVSFAIISVLTGVLSLFSYGLHTGGPVVMVWGWVVVSFFTLIVGAAMAEVCSAHPTAGGPYLWTAKLSKPSYAPFASWICGWFGLLGQMALTTSVSFGCATFIATTCTLRTSFEPEPKHVIGIYAAVMLSQSALNIYGGRLLLWLNDISVYWNALGVLLMVIPVLAKAPSHQTAKFVFTKFIDLTGADGMGWSQRASAAYVAVIGILMSQYTIIGYNASAHMAEETKNAAWIGPLGIVFAIGSSAILGWLLILSLLFSIQDIDATLESGAPVTQIFLDTVGDRGAIALMIIAVGAMYFAGLFSLMSNSRMLYAFARDGGIPGGSFFCKVDKKSKVPVRTVLLAYFLSFILALPSLGSSVAFAAATSIATIGMYICYGIPIALRVINGRDFIKGPFHLGIFSYPVAITAVLWIGFLAVAFVLPQVNPVDRETLNYAIVAVGIVFLYSLGFWVLSARKWFTGQKRQLDADDIDTGGF